MTARARVNLKEQYKRLKKTYEETAHDYLVRWAAHAPEQIHDKLEGIMYDVIAQRLGVSHFGETKSDSLAARLLTPHIDRVAQEWVDEYVKNIPQKLPKHLIQSAEESFQRGFGDAVRKKIYNVGQEYGDKQADKIRLELLGEEDFVEHVEAKLTKA